MMGRSAVLIGAVLLGNSQWAHADLEAGLAAVERKDYAAARAEFEILAEKGNADAEVNLGNLYMRGWGVPQDYAMAFDWYRKAAGRNSRLAQSKLGVLHYYGLGTVQDAAEAARWFDRAADQGDANAQSALGVLFANGDGVPRNLIKAYFWLTLAFEFGDTGANGVRLQLADDMNPGEIGEALSKVDAWKRERNIPDAGAAVDAEPSGSKAPQPAAAPKPRQQGKKIRPKKAPRGP